MRPDGPTAPSLGETTFPATPSRKPAQASSRGPMLKPPATTKTAPAISSRTPRLDSERPSLT
eukprot:1056346-Pyramimonas_sp.AAC.1